MDDARRLVELADGLATLSSVRPDGSVQLIVVNAGIVEHPVTDDVVAAFVARGATHKIQYLRGHPRAALNWRAGWAWVTIEGTVELCGPDDPLKDLDAEAVRLLMRSIARSSGMDYHDWAEYDRVVVAEGRTAVLITPERIYQNP